jgi:micrococcal nuclease
MTDLKQKFEFEATVLKVIDGDTIDLDVDLGFKIRKKVRARLARINCAELNSSDTNDKEKAVAAKQYLSKLLGAGAQVFVRSLALDIYGRSIAEVFLNTANVSDLMLDSGLATLYEANKPRSKTV